MPFRRLRPHRWCAALVLPLALCGLTTATAAPRRLPGLRALAAAATAVKAFDFTSENGGLTFTNGARLFGDAVSLGNKTSNPDYFDARLTRNLPAANESSYGAVWYAGPVDLTDGFDTRFFAAPSNAGFALIIKNPEEPQHLNAAGGDVGFNGFAHTVAVVFDNLSNRVELDVPDASGHVNQALNVKAAAAVPDATFPNGEILVRYRPRSNYLDVTYKNAFTGFDQPILRVTEFNLDTYGVLRDGNAEIGITAGGFTGAGGGFADSTLISNWRFGANLGLTGIGDGSYTQRMIFRTSRKESVWGASGRTDFGDLDLTKTYDIPIDEQSSKKLGFQAGVTGRLNGRIGVEFEGDASGGDVDVDYPLYLHLTFPRQRSLDVNEMFNLQASFDPDILATLTTTSPYFELRSYLWFKTFTDLGINLDFPVIDSINIRILDSITTDVERVKFFDTDFIMRNKGLFGIAANASSAALSLQDDEGATGPKSQHRGSPGSGSTRGAGKGTSPADFISLNLTLPNLQTNGVVASLPPDASDPGRRATAVRAAAQSPFVNLHADFTEALLSFADIDFLPLNEEFSIDLGAGNTYSGGWHIADLYGDLDFGVRSVHTFQPHPHLRLDFSPPLADGRTFVEVELDDQGRPTEIPQLQMPDHPLTVTPTVFLTNPNYDPNRNSDARFRAYNQVDTTAALTFTAGLNLNVFQLYLDLGDAVSLDTGPGMPPVGITSPSADVFKVNVPTFQLGSFIPVRGAAYTLFPKASRNPIIHTLSESSVTPFGAQDPGAETVTLYTTDADSDAVVAWNDDGSLNPTLLQATVLSRDVVRVTIPHSLLTLRGVNTLTLINGFNTVDQVFRSNVATFAVVSPKPVVTAISPSVAVLGDVPMANGQPIIQGDDAPDGTPGEKYFELLVTGTAFVPEAAGLGGTAVQWNGQSLPTTYISSTEVRARVPASLIAAAGTSQVGLLTAEPGGGASGLLPFTARNPAPVTTPPAEAVSLRRDSAAASLVISGSSFRPGAQVQITGQGHSLTPAVTFLNSQHLEVQFDATSLGDGAYTARVTNPAPGGGTSGDFPFTLDGAAPTTSTALDGPAGGGDTFRGAVTVTLSALDALTGVTRTAYSLDGGTEQTYTGPFIVSGDTEHQVTFYSVDRAGNREFARTTPIRIDSAPPLTAASLASPEGQNGWRRGPVTVTLNATDASGVDHTTYRLDGGAEQQYAGPITVAGEGDHSLSFRSADRAGNEESEQTLTFRIDSKAPAVSGQVKVGTPRWVVDPPAEGEVSAARKKHRAVGHLELPVTISGGVQDQTSGPAASGSYILRTSRGKVLASGDFGVGPDGAFSVVITLGPLSGTQKVVGQPYTLELRSADQAGNPGGRTLRGKLTPGKAR